MFEKDKFAESLAKVSFCYWSMKQPVKILFLAEFKQKSLIHRSTNKSGNYFFILKSPVIIFSL